MDAKELLLARVEAHGRWTRGEAGGKRLDLANADLANAVLTGANLARANFVDLGTSSWSAIRAAFGVRSDPCVVAAQVLAEIRERPEALNQSAWHTCDTVHCVAGWAIIKAPEGRVLERWLGTSTAAQVLLGREGCKQPSFAADASPESIMGALAMIAGEATDGR